MNLSAVISNVVYIFRNDVLDDFSIASVEEKMNILLGEDAQASSATVPQQLKVVTSQAKNIQVAAQKKQLIITDLNINESNTAETDVVRVADAVKELVGTTYLERFGFNFQFSIKPKDLTAVSERVKSKFFKEDALGDGVATFALPNICIEEGENKYVYSFLMDLDDLNQPQRMKVHASYLVDPQRHNTEGLENFIEEYKLIYRKAYDYISEQINE